MSRSDAPVLGHPAPTCPPVPLGDHALTYADVLAAQRRLAGRVVHTPVVRSDELDQLAGARLWLKAENLQRGGSFKLRGALLAVERLALAGSPGVVAQTTGNHGVAVALAAHEMRLPARIVVPRDAAPNKIERILATGARVVLSGTTLAARCADVAAIQNTLGYDVVDPYEDVDVVAGQGTATAELLDHLCANGVRPAAVVVPVGGGTALAGACLAVQGHDLDVIAAEPAAVDSLTQALRLGRPTTIEGRPTMADGLRPERVGRLPFAICRDSVSRVLTVNEDAIGDALCRALASARLLIEPSAAVALAAALRLPLQDSAFRGADIGVLITGGNVEPSLVASLWGAAA